MSDVTVSKPPKPQVASRISSLHIKISFLSKKNDQFFLNALSMTITAKSLQKKPVRHAPAKASFSMPSLVGWKEPPISIPKHIEYSSTVILPRLTEKKTKSTKMWLNELETQLKRLFRNDNQCKRVFIGVHVSMETFTEKDGYEHRLEIPENLLRFSTTLQHIHEASAMFKEGETNTILLSQCSPSSFCLILEHLILLEQKDQSMPMSLKDLAAPSLINAMEMATYLELKLLLVHLQKQFTNLLHSSSPMANPDNRLIAIELEGTSQHIRDLFYQHLSLNGLIWIESIAHQLSIKAIFTRVLDWARFMPPSNVSHQESDPSLWCFPQSLSKSIILSECLRYTIEVPIQNSSSLSAEMMQFLLTVDAHPFQIEHSAVVKIKEQWLSYLPSMPTVLSVFRICTFELTLASVDRVIHTLSKSHLYQKTACIHLHAHISTSELSRSMAICKQLGLLTLLLQMHANTQGHAETKFSYSLSFSDTGMHYDHIHKWNNILINTTNTKSSQYPDKECLALLEGLTVCGLQHTPKLFQHISPDAAFFLDSLHLDDIHILDAQHFAKSFAQFIVFSKIRSLRLKGLKLSSMSVIAIMASLQRHPHLQHLHLEQLPLSIGLPELLKLLRHATQPLLSLRLPFCQLNGDAMLQVIDALVSRQSPLIVDLSENQIDDLHASMLGEYVARISIQTFIMTTSNTQYALSDISLASMLQKLVHSPYLINVVLNGHGMSTATTQVLVKALTKSAKMRFISMTKNYLKREDISLLLKSIPRNLSVAMDFRDNLFDRQQAMKMTRMAAKLAPHSIIML